MIPFMTEDIYQNLVKSVNPDAPESIHLCDFPAVDEAMIDEKLEQDMGEVLDIVVLGRAARNASGIKNRQPIGQMFVNGEAALTDYYKQIIEGELNVKDVFLRMMYLTSQITHLNLRCVFLDQKCRCQISVKYYGNSMICLRNVSLFL